MSDQKTFDWNKPTVQLLGRYQPWHEGHRELFKRAIAKTGQVAIMLRHARDEHNPFDIEERSRMITVDLSAHGFERDVDYVIVEVPNITNITYGRDVGYKVEQEKLDDQIEQISATDIRNKLNRK